MISILARIISQLFTMAYVVLCDLAPDTCLILSYSTLPLIHCTPATLAFQFLQIPSWFHTFHLLFPLPSRLFVSPSPAASISFSDS